MLNVRFTLSIAVAAVLIATATPTLGGRELLGDQLPLRIAASIVDANGVPLDRNSAGTITITRWTTAAERESLKATLLRGGTKALLVALVPVRPHGEIRIPDWQGPDTHKLLLGWNLRYAWRETDPDGVQRIVVATDRYMSYQEGHEHPDSTDYPFTMIDLRLDANGVGVGKAAVAARIRFNQDNLMELENYHAAPDLLLHVSVQK